MAWAERLEERLRGAELQSDPFPHLILDDLLPEDLMASAIRSFPDPSLISDLASRSGDLQPNARASLDLATVEGSSDRRLENLKAFYRALGVEDLVRSLLVRIGPCLEKPLGAGPGRLPLRPRMSADDRQNWLQGTPSLSYDIQPGINPPRFAGLEPHLDDKYEVFAGLLYVHPGESPPVGGDLILYERHPDQVFEGTRLKGNPYAARPVKRIAYRHNRLVVLLNGPAALHGVTPYLQSENQQPRRLFNIIVEAYNVPCKSYGYSDLPRGSRFTTLSHALKGGVKLLRHRLLRAVAPARVADQLKRFTPGELMDRWEYWG